MSTQTLSSIAKSEPFSPAVRSHYVELRPLIPATAHLVAAWLDEPAVHKWLDFGGGRQVLSRTALMTMERSGGHAIRTVHDEAGEPFGVIALSHIDGPFRNAWVWGVRDPERKRAPLRAWLRAIFGYGFTQLGLRSIYTQIVELNHPSLKEARRAGMRDAGRQRLAHMIDGEFCDRLLLDITDTEYRQAQPVSAGD